jgi:hypothetical protein
MFEMNNGEAPTRIFLALPVDCAIFISTSCEFYKFLAG